MSELSPRGPLTAFLLEHVRDRVRALPLGPAPDVADPLGDHDLQLALYLCYELHFRGLPGVDDRWEWDPGLLAWRRELEDAFEAALLERIAWPREVPAAGEMDVALRAILDAAGPEEPSLSRHLERTGTLDQFREFVVHRSAYHLREADPHSFAIPRIDGRPKAALVEIQADEYGGGDPERIHARLFAATARAPVQQLAGTPAVEVVEAVGVAPGDLVLTRSHGVGPMGGTDLDPVLRNLGVTTLVVAGVSVNVAITNLVMDAVNHGYQVVLPRDAVCGVPADYADAVIDNTLALLATVTTTDEIAAAWAGPGNGTRGGGEP